MNLSAREKKEMLRLVRSRVLRRDMARVRAASRARAARMSADGYIDFVTQFADFIGHRRRPFKPIKGEMKL